MRDLDIRRALRRRLAHQHRDDRDARVVEEFEVCLAAARIDLAVINGRIEGYEIKSDRDSLSRLGKQAEVYGRVFDRVIAVVGSRHLDQIILRTPAWWGVIEARTLKSGEVGLRTVRRSRTNPVLDARAVASLLRRHEQLQVLARHGLAVGRSSKPSPLLASALATELSLRDLRAEVRRSLCLRPGWRAVPLCESCDDSFQPPARWSDCRWVRPPHKR